MIVLHFFAILFRRTANNTSDYIALRECHALLCLWIRTTNLYEVAGEWLHLIAADGHLLIAAPSVVNRLYNIAQTLCAFLNHPFAVPRVGRVYQLAGS